MKALLYLYMLRTKASIRNMFSKPSSAIMAILIIVIYGGMFIALLTIGTKKLTISNSIMANLPIVAGIGCSAVMIGMMLLQSKKALFMENDAFYLFSGPFKRSQTMHFIMSQSIMSAFMCGVISLFFMTLFSTTIRYSISFLILVFVAHSLLYFFFTILYYYLYLLSIKDAKYKYISYATIVLFVGCTIGVFIAVIAQNNFSIQNAGMLFLNSELFYIIPMFGWVKLMLVSAIVGNVAQLLLATSLLLVSCVIIYVLMLRFKGDFIERAMEDAVEFTARYKEIRAGNRTSFKDKKVRSIQSSFKEGAAAIFSKNMLLLRKSNAFISFNDFIFIGIYLAISYFGDLGYAFYIYMMMVWLFTTVQNADFMREMGYHHIYLIPEAPLKKLLYLLAPYVMKYVLLVAVPVVIGGIVFQTTIQEMLQFYVMLAGYACLFISASVLATRILKSRNNKTMESMMSMFVMLLAALPSLFIMWMIVSLQLFSIYMYVFMSLCSLLMNFVVSACIIFACRSMMNGREIKSA